MTQSKPISNEISNREAIKESILSIVKERKPTAAEFVLALSEAMSVIGVSLYKTRTQEEISCLTPDLLKVLEKEHYSAPHIDTALILTASNMILWAEDSSSFNQ